MEFPCPGIDEGTDSRYNVFRHFPPINFQLEQIVEGLGLACELEKQISRLDSFFALVAMPYIMGLLEPGFSMFVLNDIHDYHILYSFDVSWA